MAEPVRADKLSLAAKQVLLQYHDVRCAIPEPGVEAENRGIAGAYHQVKARQSGGGAPSLGGSHQRVGGTSPPVCFGDSEVIDPAAMTIVAGHDRADDDPTFARGKDRRSRADESTAGVRIGVVPRTRQPRAVPQRGSGRDLGFGKRGDLNHRQRRRH